MPFPYFVEMLLDIVDERKELHPSLNFLFTNQHMNPRELKVSPEIKLYHQIDRFDSTEIRDHLREFKEKFAF